MAVREEILLKLKKQDADNTAEILKISRTLGLKHWRRTQGRTGYSMSDWDFHAIIKDGKEEEVRQNLTLIFGEAAFKKAAAKLDFLDAQYSFFATLSSGPELDKARTMAIARNADPDDKYGRTSQVVVSHFSYHYTPKEFRFPLSQLFPALTPKERKEVKAQLETVGFTFEGQKVTGNKFMPPKK